jgi:hypothetical protein
MNGKLGQLMDTTGSNQVVASMKTLSNRTIIDQAGGAIAPNTEPMLDSRSMCASASKLFAASRSSLLPGSLALLLLLRR